MPRRVNSRILEIKMTSYTTKDIRNIVLIGHSSAGKTSLAESMLHKAGVTTRLGSVDDKTSILDCDAEEKERGHSVDSAVAHVHRKGIEINIIDTPGYPDFLGAAIPALGAAETAVVVVSATAGIQMNTRKMFQYAKDRGMACMIVVNKIDSGTDDIMNLVKTIQESFGTQCRCANLPTAKGDAIVDCLTNSGGTALEDVASTRTNLIETIVEADEVLMEAYLGGEEIPADKIATTFTKGMVAQSVIPILFTSARNEVGIEPLMDFIAHTCPSPLDGKPTVVVSGEGESQTHKDIKPDISSPLVGLVFRVASDPRTHIKATSVRIFSGAIKSDSNIQSTSSRKGMRSGHVNKLQGDKLEPIEAAIPGDIVTLSKLDELRVLDTIYIGNDPGRIPTPTLPIPMFSLALEPKSRGDETKISGALSEVTEADPTFVVTRDGQSHELIVSGLGELHVRVILARMQHRRGLEMNTKPPTIPYRETITGSVKMVEYTHKKQSGGAGQFGRVFIDMEPNERGAGYEFVDKIFGGVIDQSFRPSVDKGCQAAVHEGVLAGFPVVDVKVLLVDGKTHPVDSKDIAFQIAGREAFRKAFMLCKPALLEPIVHLEVTVPGENVGDITGDLAGRRGRIQGQDMLPGGMAIIKAQVPLGEVQQYNSQLKSVTGGQGSYTMELSHYEPVPGNVQQQIIAKRQAEKAAEHK